MIFWQWGAMVTSYLSARVVDMPFKDLTSLIEQSDFKIGVLKGTSMIDSFKFAKDPIWVRAWNERISPYLNSYKDNNEEMVLSVLTDKKMALYNNFFSVRFVTIFSNFRFQRRSEIIP